MREHSGGSVRYIAMFASLQTGRLAPNRYYFERADWQDRMLAVSLRDFRAAPYSIHAPDKGLSKVNPFPIYE
jgi:hypothetical protein